MGISSFLVRKSIESPRLGRAADLFGRAMSKLTAGRYKTGLSRSAYRLAGMAREGDFIGIRENKLFLNGSCVMEGDLFRGIVRDNIQVSGRMLTPKGMTSSLRWDLIGNAPDMCNSMIPMAFTGLFLSAAAFHVYSDYSPYLSDFFRYDKLLAAFGAFSFIPFHKLIRLFIRSNDGEQRLSNVEGFEARVIAYHRGEPHSRSADGYVSYQDKLDRTIHIRNGVESGEKPSSQELIEAHEKAHLLGASEFSAYRIQQEKFFKGIIYEKRTIRERAGYLLRNCLLLTPILAPTLAHNLLALGYGIGNKDVLDYYVDDGNRYYRLLSRVNAMLRRSGHDPLSLSQLLEMYARLGSQRA